MKRVAVAAWVVLLVTVIGSAAGSISALAEDEPLLASAPGQALSLIVGRKVRIAQVTRDGLTSPGFYLAGAPDRLDGKLGAEALDLRFGRGRIAGSAGSGAVALEVSRTRERMRVAGTFGARAVAMELRPTAIQAQIGPCWYTMALMLGRYQGHTGCRGPTQSVELTVPASLLGHTDLEIASMLTALLVPEEGVPAGPPHAPKPTATANERGPGKRPR